MTPARDDRGACGREIVGAGVLIGCLMVVLVLTSGAYHMFGRYLWHDEICSWKVGSDPNLAHAVAAMAAGVDSNLPTYNLTLHMIGKFTGGLDAKRMRLTAFVFMAMALTGLYATLRQGFPRVPSLAGVLAAYSSSELLAHAFEGRQYTPLIAAAAWFAFALAWSPETRHAQIVRGMLLAIAGALLCLFHYFGILAWTLMVGTALWASRGTLGQRLRALAPAGVGPATLLCFTRYYLAQRANTPAVTWAPPMTPGLVWKVLAEDTPSLAMGAALAAWLLSRRERRQLTPDLDAPGESPISRLKPLAPLLALLLYLPALLAFSVFIQPAPVPRYYVPFVLGCAPCVAWLAWRSTRSHAVFLCLLLILLTYSEHRDLNRWHMLDDHKIDAYLGELRQNTGRDIVVISRRANLYPTLTIDASLRARVGGLDCDNFPASYLGQFHWFERDQARAVQAYYAWPRLFRVEELSRHERFFVDAPPDDLPWLKGQFPAYTFGRVFDQVYVAQRRPH